MCSNPMQRTPVAYIPTLYVIIGWQITIDWSSVIVLGNTAPYTP